MELFAWLDNSALAIWVRESPSLWAYPGIITFHTVGLAMLVGIHTVIDLLILRGVPNATLAPAARLFPVMWLGFWINAVSGLLLLTADAAVMLGNPVMWVKFGFVGAGVVVMRLVTHGVFPKLSGTTTRPPGARLLAVVSLICWGGAITAGRLTAYIGF